MVFRILAPQTRLLTAVRPSLSPPQPRPCLSASLSPSFYFLPARLSSTCCSKKTTTPVVPPPTTLAFWQSPPTWRRAGVNTLRCLVGCSVGDFSVMWYLQTHHADWGMWPTIMSLAIASGLATSVALETVLLRLGKDGLSWAMSARTAVGMSFISMVTMEAAENIVDYWLTSGGQAAGYTFGEPLFWAAAAVSMVAGFLAPLPYNYLRLRKPSLIALVTPRQLFQAYKMQFWQGVVLDPSSLLVGRACSRNRPRP